MPAPRINLVLFPVCLLLFGCGPSEGFKKAEGPIKAYSQAAKDLVEAMKKVVTTEDLLSHQEEVLAAAQTLGESANLLMTVGQEKVRRSEKEQLDKILAEAKQVIMRDLWREKLRIRKLDGGVLLELAIDRSLLRKSK